MITKRLQITLGGPNFMAKKIFYLIILALIILVISCLGSIIKITNPLLVLLHIVGIAGVFIGGYVLGRKTK